MHEIREADESSLAVVRELFLEYAGGLDVDLSFQDFEAELAALPAGYDRILLAFVKSGESASPFSVRSDSSGS